MSASQWYYFDGIDCYWRPILSFMVDWYGGLTKQNASIGDRTKPNDETDDDFYLVNHAKEHDQLYFNWVTC